MVDQLIPPINDAYGLSSLLGPDSNARLPAGRDDASNLFGLLLVRLLIQTASELQRLATTPADASQNSILDASGVVAQSAPALANNQAIPYASEVATRAYLQGDQWKFVPVQIPPTPALNAIPESVSAAVLPSTPDQAITAAAAAPVTPARPTAAASPATGALSLSEYPHPPDDNGRGMHWTPTVSSTKQEVDRFIPELKAMNVRWVVFLNDHTNLEQNEYLVDQLVANGIEPVMRVYTSGVEPIAGELSELVRHYVARGAHYFQLYNEPNHAVENGGQAPDVARYLDLWIPAAKTVVENGGLPGLGALSPGDSAGVPQSNPQRLDDRLFLQSALQEIKRRGETEVLDKAWLSAHNYMGARSLDDPDGLLRVKQYDEIVRGALGRSLPIIGTEGGSYAGGPITEARQAELVTDAMRYMRDERESYNFAYTYWIIANSLGGGGDDSWESQALFRYDGTSPVVAALKDLT